MDITKLYESQISLSEWFEKIGHRRASELRVEDNEKRERLKMLREAIGLPYDAPTQFRARDLALPTLEFERFLAERGHELCALRLIPTDPTLPKLRMRGKSVRDVMGWFAEQDIDPEKYRADFVPHAEDNIWSTIFVVGNSGVIGEITRGGHHELTQGFYDEPPLTFRFDFNQWTWSREDREAEGEMQDIVSRLRVGDPEIRRRLTEKLNATFAGEYLSGYFETVTSASFGLWFVDYNRILGEALNDKIPVQSEAIAGEAVLRGQCGSPGTASGRVRIVTVDEIGTALFQDGDVLVCPMTTPDYIPLMIKASAIVTDQGGVLSHAAIVARELGKPCMVGTLQATVLLSDGDMIKVKADEGSVIELKNFSAPL